MAEENTIERGEAERACVAAVLIRATLKDIPKAMLEKMIVEIDWQESIGPLLDPSRFQGSAFEELAAQKDAAGLMIKLKEVWRQV